MNKGENRRLYEFDPATKREALDSKPLCDHCGEPERKNDRFECDHILAIWFARENPALAPEVIKSLANLEILHHSCHRKKHERESRRMYQELAPQVLQAYLSMIVDHSKDDWRTDPNHHINRTYT